MTRKTQRLLRKIIPYVLVLILGALIVVGTYIWTEPKEDPDAPTGESETETEPDFGDFPTVSALDVANVDRLVNHYYEAKIADDADTLNELVQSETRYNVADLANETQFISKYANFKTYVIPGPEEQYFIVYVKYEIFFSGIKTGAPALNHFLIKKNEDGSYVIYDEKLSKDLQKYITDTENTDTVKGLKAQVEKELLKACEDNEDLNLLIKLLQEEEVKESTEKTSEETEKTESENAEETESQEN